MVTVLARLRVFLVDGSFMQIIGRAIIARKMRSQPVKTFKYKKASPELVFSSKLGALVVEVCCKSLPGHSSHILNAASGRRVGKTALPMHR